MKLNIAQFAQLARNAGQAGRQRERPSEAFQAAIDYFRLDVGRQREPAGPSQAVRPDSGACAPAPLNPSK